MASPLRSTGAPTARRQAVEASLLEATAALLYEGLPFADLSVERISRKAGISRTAFYFYFADKRELLERLTSDVNALILEQANMWWEDSGPPADRLRDALANALAIYREYSVLIRATAEVATYDEEVSHHRRGLLEQVAEVTERHIAEENAAGRAACEFPRTTALALTWMTESAFLQQVAGEPAIDEGEMVEALASIWLRSIYGVA